ncbi:hypothetical protein GCM10022248_85070 [Nonomuraea soli]
MCLLVAGVLLALTAGGSRSVQAAGTRYAVTVVPGERVEVRVTSGVARAVTLAAVMPGMGHALPPVETVEAGPGRFVAAGPVFTMDGVWELVVTVSGQRGEELITVTVLV